MGPKATLEMVPGKQNTKYFYFGIIFTQYKLALGYLSAEIWTVFISPLLKSPNHETKVFQMAAMGEN